MHMNGSKRPGEAALSFAPEGASDTEVAVVALTEIQRLAAERRAIAEDMLAQARVFEEQLANERNAIGALAATAEAAQAAEREAEQRVRQARDYLAAFVSDRASGAQRDAELSRAVDAANAEFAAAQVRLHLAHEAYEAALAARAAQQSAAAEVSAPEADAQAELDSALRSLDESRVARERANAAVAEMRSRIELLSGTNGLSADAVKRVIERRLADALRHQAGYDIT
jgi:hypothetical protein